LEADVSTKLSDEPTERTRAAVASNAEEYRSRIAKRLRAVKGRMCGGKATEEQIADRLEADVSTKRSDEPTERTRAAVASNAEEYRSRIAKRLRAVKAVSSREWHPVDKPILEDTLTSKIDPTERTRAAVAKKYGIPERKLRAMQEISKHSPDAVADIRDGKKTIKEAIGEIKLAGAKERYAESRKHGTPQCFL